MTVLDLKTRPHAEVADLMQAIDRGEHVVIQRDGEEVAQMVPVRRSRFSRESFAFRRTMNSQVYAGNSVVDARQEERF